MFTGTRWIQLVCASVVLLLCVTGCFRRGPELAPVTGTVTLDGEPLVNAQVEFKPMRGNPSYGTTDELGRYELRYTKDKAGGVVGSHVVRITTQTTAVDSETGSEIQVPQRVPERYNERSQLIREVKPGENQFYFGLTSEPETAETGAPEAEAAEAGVEEPKAEGRESEDADTPEAKAEPPAAEES